MKQILIIIFTFILLSFKPSQKYSIKVRISSCSEFKRKYSTWIYLFKDNKKIDSIKTNIFLGCYGPLYLHHYKKNIKFRNLRQGEYQIKYLPTFKFDSIVDINIIDKNRKIKICFDKIPEEEYKQSTLLDKIQLNDTLYIKAYISSRGEFGGYEEEIRIWNDNNNFKAQFYKLAEIYNSTKVIDEKAISKQLNLNDKNIKDINRFLIEIRNLNRTNYYLLGADKITIYNKSNKYKITIHDWKWKPYLELKKIIIKDNEILSGNTAGDN